MLDLMIYFNFLIELVFFSLEFLPIDYNAIFLITKNFSLLQHTQI
jgi:hypothetical protein